jgi:putative DNA primase/helicase
VAFGALARIVLLAAKKTDADSDSPPRIFVRAKSNIGPSGGGFGYDIVAAPLMEQPDITATRIKWLDPIEGTARELLAEAEAQPTEEKTQSKIDQAKKFLKDALAKHARPQPEIEEEAEQLGISKKTLFRASVEAGVHKEKRGMNGGWFWSL